MARTALPRAVTVAFVSWDEYATAPGALALCKTVLAAAVRLERRSAVGANDPQVLKAVVVRHAVDVVEDQRHTLAVPLLALTAELTLPRLQPGLIKAILQLRSLVSGVLDQNLCQWLRSVSLEAFGLRLGCIEVVGGNAPDHVDIPTEEGMISANWS
jgi:hypothetical protein